MGDPTTEYAIWLGLDVGKSNHHGCALTSTAERVYDREPPQEEAALRQVITGLQERGPVLVVVDQPNTIGALPVAVARACGAEVAYLPGLAMRKAADLYPGTAKTPRPRWVHHRRHRHRRCPTRCGQQVGTPKCSRR